MLGNGARSPRPAPRRGLPAGSFVCLRLGWQLPLVLSQDDLWLSIAQGVGAHVRQNAESLRERLVRPPGEFGALRPLACALLVPLLLS